MERGTLGTLAMTWEDTGSGSWSVYRGTLLSLWAEGVHDFHATGACRVLAPSASLSIPPEDSYYLVVTDCGVASSSGQDSLGRDRGEPAVPCP